MATSFSGGRSRSIRREPPTMGKLNGKLYYLRLWVECTLFGIYKAGRIVYATYDCILLKAKFLFTLPMVVLTFALIYSHLKSPREKVEIWMVFTKVSYFLPSVVMGITHWLKQKGHLSVIMKSELIFSFWYDIWSVTSWYDAVHS